jgi:uncharacterized repeat protein (TIGR03806 family)
MKPLRTNGSLLLVRSLAALSLLTCVQADLTHRWSFNNAAGDAPRGTTMTDSVSSAVATVQGNGSTFSGTALTITGSTTGNRSRNFISGYVDLPNGIISGRTNLSVEIWAAPLSGKNYGRIFDFGRVNTAGLGGGAPGEIIDQGQGNTPGLTTASDSLMLSSSIGTDLGLQRLEARLNGGNVAAFDSALPTTAGTPYHYVMTFADGEGTHGSTGGRMTWYRNGVLVGSADVAFHLSDIEDVNNWLGRSQFTGDDNANAAYDELRLYDHVLDAVEIATHFTAGPDGAVTPPPIPDHLWVFNDAANSTVPSGEAFTDSIGGMVATLRGQGGALTGTSVRLPGSTTGNQPLSSISAYLDLPNGIVSAQAAITFEAWATPLSSKNWQRLFDFGRCVTSHGSGAATGEILDTTTAPGGTAGYDNLSLTFSNGLNLNSQQLEGQYDGHAPQFTFSTAATTAGTQYHYVFIVQNGVGEFGAAGCQARWYRDGVLQNSDDFPFLATAMEDVNNWIGRSMYSGDSNSHLALNELRIYNRAITAAEVQASYVVGPDPNSGPPEPLPPVPVPENRWDFNAAAGSAPAGTTFTDTGSGEIATVRGNDATTTGTSLLLPGTTTGNQAAAAISAYLDLPNGFVSSRPSATYEIWVTPVSSKNWQRIFDFGRCDVTANSSTPGEVLDGAASPGTTTSYDGLMLSLNNGGALGSHRLEAIIGDTGVSTVNTDLSGTTASGTEYHYAMVIEDGAGASGAAGSQVRWYRNGELQGSMDLGYRMPSISDVNNWIGRSAWSGDSNSNIAVNELRVHSRAVSTKELLASVAAGADATFDPPVAEADSATIHPEQKVLVDVLANDTGSPIPGTLEIVNPPAIGSATISNGKILYSHSGSSAGPVTFTYGVGNVSGTTATATVTIHFASSLRLTNAALAMPEAPPTNAWQLVDALPGLTFNQPVCMTSPPGDTHRLFVCERMAKIKHVPDVTASTPTQNTFLDLQSVVTGRTPTETIEGGGNAEHGLLGLAFHPQYASNGYFYVAYTVRISGGSYHQRISRFHVSEDAAVADPASELILLQQLDQGSNHDGGDLHFGPNDGYLYYTAGDEENPNDFRLNSQKINGDFFCGVFRLDVDKKPGNLEPNAHDAIPTDGGIARFSVPIDNPFVHTSLGGAWGGDYNGVEVAPLSGVRTEFWATGLRHTWRMSFDPATGDLWGGDVGQDTYEEVNKIVKGGNYGWVYREGKHDTAFTNPVPPTKPAGFTSIDPIYEYVHAAVAGGDASFKGNSVVGGYVYRGTRYPSLAGTYIFSDSVSGHVWQMNTTTGETTRLTGLPGAYGVFSAQGVDPFNKDLYFAAYLTGKIMRLTTGSDTADGFPTTLSATGLFADLSDLSPSPGLLPYQPNLSFWSDHAIKRRWFTIPSATDKMTWSKDGTWTYPTGMLWVKHFDLELSRGNPATKKRIETRVLVKTDTGSYGVSYRWNEAQTEAMLVEDAGTEFDIAIDDQGTPHTQRWQIPGRSSCITCHTPQGGHALSFNTRQLNLDQVINGYSGNQLDLLSIYDYLNNTPDPASSLARHVRPDETQYPLEQRARSYFAVNCSYCHQAGGSVGGFWDGRPELTLEQTGMVNGEAENNGGNPLNKYIVPGDTTHSVILNRMAASNGFGRMPPLGSSELDLTNIQLITDWINNELSDRPLYDEWRDGFFAAVDPNGDKTADPDGDGVTNYDEYLRGSSPVSGGNPWQATVANGKLQFMRQSHRYYAIERSDDLGEWEPWSIPEIDSAYQAGDTLTEIPLPSDPGGRTFFRFKITEP